MADFSELSALYEPIVRKIAANMANPRTPTLLVGSPGTGKTMLARRLNTLLPPLSLEAQAQLSEIYGRTAVSPLIARAFSTRRFPAIRPFRAPHYTISNAALEGTPAREGRTERSRFSGELLTIYEPRPARPGEVELASYGVLFLDEAVEFRPEALRSVARLIGNPDRIDAPYLVLAANPCYCGWAGASVRQCVCTPTALRGYEQRLDQIQDLFGARRVAMPYIEPLRLDMYGACASSETIAREAGI